METLYVYTHTCIFLVYDVRVNRLQTHVDLQGTHAIISFGPNAMTERTFYGPKPSTDDIYL